MKRNPSIAAIRAMIQDGMTDGEIAEHLAECAAAEADDLALYGEPDDEYSHGRHITQCDEYYERNDAGEYSWM